MRYYRENPQETPKHDWFSQSDENQETQITQEQSETVDLLRRLHNSDAESGDVE